MKKIKKLLILLVSLIFTPKYKFDIKDSKKILFSARFKIGDSIMLFPLLREMKKNNPNLEIDILCSNKSNFMFANNKNISNVFTLYKGLDFFLHSIPQWFFMRKNSYDLIIELSPIKFGNFFYYASLGANKYIAENSVNRYKLNLNRLSIFSELVEENTTQYMAASYFRYLELFNYKLDNKKLEIFTTDEKREFSKSYFSKYEDKKIVLINIDGSSYIRSLHKQDYLYLAEQISDIENTVVFFTSLPNKRVTLEKELVKLNNTSLSYETKDIFDVIAMVEYIDLLISPDTSLLHIANALEKEAVGIYSSSSVSTYIWFDKNSKISAVRSKHVDSDSIQGFDKAEVISIVKEKLGR